jgi:hypothetical protein
LVFEEVDWMVIAIVVVDELVEDIVVELGENKGEKACFHK